MNDLRGTAAILMRVWSVMWPGKYGYKHLISIMLLGSLLTGCTTLRPIDVDAKTLHQKIRSGEAIEVGDTIHAITIDGVAHMLYVTAVDDNVVKGKPPGPISDVADTVLPIDDIVLIEVSRLSAESGRAFAGGAGTGVIMVGLFFLILGLTTLF